MSIDKKAFGISDSLIQAVNEALKGNQHKIDVAEPKGKITGADFKKLRGEGAKPDFLDLDKDGNKKEPMKTAVKQAKEEVEVTEADNAVAKQIAAKKDAFKKQLQQKIAAKQMNTMQAKANKRLANIHASNSKCTCQEGKKSMSCEVCNGDKGMKGGKEQIIVNPPMREAAELPKKVITKGHEIAKSIIKHKGKVDNPYAVGMAAAKKSAGIKEEAEQVDEKKAYEPDKLTKARNPLVYGDKKKSNPLVYGDKHRDNPLVYGKKKVTKEEAEQVDEVSLKTKINAYKAASSPDADYNYGSKVHAQADRLRSKIAAKHGEKAGTHADRAAYGKPSTPATRSAEKAKSDPLTKATSSTNKMRITKSGVANKQDQKSNAAIIKSRLGKHGKSNLPEEDVQIDEVLDSPIKKMAYIMKAKKSIEKSDPKKIKQANDIANRVIGIKRVMNKVNKKD